jgi:hypothetical protein
MRWFNELHARVLTGALSGGIKGAALGTAASLASGAAIVATAPAWLPFLGGTAVVALGTVAVWSGIGCGLGVVASGARAYSNHKAAVAEFEEAFPAVATRKGVQS